MVNLSCQVEEEEIVEGHGVAYVVDSEHTALISIVEVAVDGEHNQRYGTHRGFDNHELQGALFTFPEQATISGLCCETAARNGRP